MATQEEKYSDMRLMLQEGLDILSSSSNENRYMLNQAIIKIHGALEKYIRLEVGRKVPSLQTKVEDLKETTWYDLIGYSKQYLEFTEYDARTITKANEWRKKAAHGENQNATLDELKQYASFVQRKCGQAQAGVSKDQQTQKAINPPPSPLPVIPAPRRNGMSGPAKFTLYLVLFFIVCCVGGYIIWMGQSPQGIRDMLDQMKLPTIESVNISPGPSAPFQGVTSVAIETKPLPGANTSCTIVWTEYKRGNLGGKNRSMVWDEIVAEQVKRLRHDSPGILRFGG